MTRECWGEHQAPRALVEQLLDEAQQSRGFTVSSLAICERCEHEVRVLVCIDEAGELLLSYETGERDPHA